MELIKPNRKKFKILKSEHINSSEMIATSPQKQVKADTLWMAYQRIDGQKKCDAVDFDVDAATAAAAKERISKTDTKISTRRQTWAKAKMPLVGTN